MRVNNRQRRIRMRVQLMTCTRQRDWSFRRCTSLEWKNHCFRMRWHWKSPADLRRSGTALLRGAHRAMKQLVLTHAGVDDYMGRIYINHFLDLCVKFPDLVREVRLRSQISRPAPWASTRHPRRKWAFLPGQHWSPDSGWASECRTQNLRGGVGF